MREEKAKRILTTIGAAFLITFTFLPLIYMVLISLSGNPDFLSGVAPFAFTLRNYTDILAKPTLHFVHYLRNSVAVSGLTALIAVAAGSLAAYALSRLRLPGKTAIILATLAISTFPQVSVIGHLFKLIGRVGLVNTWTALILSYTAWVLPLILWILTGYISQISTELDDAALVDGCPRWKVLLKVILPVSAPAIFSAALLAFIFAFNEFLFALMLTTDHHARTVTVGIALFQGLHGEIPWGEIMAASTLSVIPVIVLTAIFQRRVLTGLTAGAIKG